MMMPAEFWGSFGPIVTHHGRQRLATMRTNPGRFKVSNVPPNRSPMHTQGLGQGSRLIQTEAAAVDQVHKFALPGASLSLPAQVVSFSAGFKSCPVSHINEVQFVALH